MENVQIDKAKIKAIITDGDTDALIAYAQAIGEKAANADLGTSQVRNIFGMVKEMQAQPSPDFSELKLLVPKLHYAAAKQTALKEMAAALTEAIRLVTNEKKFKRFASFFEAIVAYHYAKYADRKGRR